MQAPIVQPGPLRGDQAHCGERPAHVSSPLFGALRSSRAYTALALNCIKRICQCTCLCEPARQMHALQGGRTGMPLCRVNFLRSLPFRFLAYGVRLSVAVLEGLLFLIACTMLLGIALLRGLVPFLDELCLERLHRCRTVQTSELYCLYISGSPLEKVNQLPATHTRSTVAASHGTESIRNAFYYYSSTPCLHKLPKIIQDC